MTNTAYPATQSDQPFVDPTAPMAWGPTKT